MACINITINQLRERYSNEKKSIQEIAGEFKCNPESIRKRLHKFGIEVRPKFYKAKLKSRKDITRELLSKEYLVNGKTMKQIAKELNCGETVIWDRLKIFGIPRRPRAYLLKGKPKSFQHRLNLALSTKKRPTGNLAWNWKGGISTDHKAIRNRSKYIAFRRMVLLLRGEKCEKCGKSLLEKCPTCGHRPDRHVHHKIPFSLYENKRTSFDNAIVLCESCHQLQHTQRQP